MASITFLGATRGVTGSRFLVFAGRSCGLVDCGLFQGPREVVQRNWAPLPFEPSRLDWVVLTHAHLDHVGYLPRLVRAGFRGPVYATPATLDLARLLLVDAGCIQEDDAEVAALQGWQADPPLYTAADARACFATFHAMDYDQRHSVAPDVQLRLRDAGHILGSASVELWIALERDRSVKIVFSGDLGRSVTGLLRPPTPIEAADELVLESTYGDRTHSDEPVETVLADAVDAALAAGGRLLIPTFAVGRAQDMLFLLRVLQAAGRIPELPIYLDGPLAYEATELFAAYPAYHGPAVRAWLARAPHAHIGGSVTLVTSLQQTREILQSHEPIVVVSSGGMATGGRTLSYLRAWLPDARTVVLFPGYQAAGTPGRALIDGAQAIEIQHEMVPVRARVRQSDAFSAHADASAILNWLAGFRLRPHRVFLVHGEPHAMFALARRIRATLGWQTRIPTFGEKVRLLTRPTTP